jgi:hypothetical protein
VSLPLYRVAVRPYPDQPPVEVELPATIEQYRELWARIAREQEALHQETFKALLRIWTAADQFFLLRHVMSAGRHAWSAFRNEPHFDAPVHIELARKIQFDPNINNTVLIGARGIGKSSLFDADDIHAKLLDANHTTCVFSLTKDLAKKHLEAIQRELDTNELLKFAWPERFWKDDDERTKAPGRPSWTVSQGLCLKRTSARPECSWEAHSFEFQLPAGLHFDRRRYDDIEADRAVERDLTAQTIENRWVSSQNLTSSLRQRRTTGTYYSPGAMMVKLGSIYGLEVLLYPGEDTKDPVPPEFAGPLGGRPVNGFTREELWTRLRDAGGAEKLPSGTWRKTSNQLAYVDYARQTACDPMAGEALRLEWALVRFYDAALHVDAIPLRLATGTTIVVCADCTPGTGSDATAIWVWALTRDKEFFWVDGEQRVMQPAERKKTIHDVCQRWVNAGAAVRQLRLEQFGQAQYVTDQQEYWNALPRFPAPEIKKCNDNRSPARGEGKTWSIFDRWQPNLASGKVVFPREMWRMNELGTPIDLVAFFKSFEFGMFPNGKDNLLDAGKLIWEDPQRVGELPWPKESRYLEPPKPVVAQSYESAGIL